MENILQVLSEERNSIPYRPSLAFALGKTNAAILLQQVLYWYYITGRPKAFYKFKEPCGHDYYKDGDDWSTELSLSAEEFDTAIKTIGTKVNSREGVDEILKNDKALFDKNGRMLNTKLLVIYRTNIDRRTFYRINEGLFISLLNHISSNPEIYNKKVANIKSYDENYTDFLEPTYYVNREPSPSKPEATVQIDREPLLCNTEITTENNILVVSTKPVSKNLANKAEEESIYDWTERIFKQIANGIPTYSIETAKAPLTNTSFLCLLISELYGKKIAPNYGLMNKIITIANNNPKLVRDKIINSLNTKVDQDPYVWVMASIKAHNKQNNIVEPKKVIKLDKNEQDELDMLNKLVTVPGNMSLEIYIENRSKLLNSAKLDNDQEQVLQLETDIKRLKRMKEILHAKEKTTK